MSGGAIGYFLRVTKNAQNGANLVNVLKFNGFILIKTIMLNMSQSLFLSTYIKMMSLCAVVVLFAITSPLGNAQKSLEQKSTACSIVDDTAETLFQLRQSGFDLGDADINQAELTVHEAQLLTDMIEDIKQMPVYQLKLLKDQALQKFIQKWNKNCQERYLEGLKQV